MLCAMKTCIYLSSDVCKVRIVVMAEDLRICPQCLSYMVTLDLEKLPLM